MRFVAIAAAGLAALLVGMSIGSAKDWTGTTVRIGTDATYPPFESQDAGGNIVGFDVDIGMAVCAEVKLKCEFSNQDWDGIIPALTAGKIDAILSSMSITEERLKTIDFSNKIYNTPPAIAVPKDSPITSVDLSAFDGKSVGVQSSTTHATYAEQKLKGADVKYYKTADDYKLDLSSGRLDAAMDDVVVLGEWLKSPDGACCKLLGTLKIVPEIHGQGTGIGVRKEDTDLKELFNKGIAAIRANGKYKEINDKYFDFDAYGE
jgi:polar amino acid transport system substrate-binding protein